MAATYSSLEGAQYGAPIGDFGGSKARIFLILCCIVLLLLGGFFVAVAPSTGSSGDSSGVVADVIAGAIFLAGALYCAWTIFSWRGAHAQLFEQGFVVSRAGKTTSARWDDVASVTAKVVVMRYYGIPFWTSRLYTLTLANGETLRLTNAFAQASKLGESVQRMSANVLLPRAISSYQTGATLPFGRFGVSQAGISNGRDTLPWNDVNQLTFQNGNVIITRKGKMLRWASAPVAKTPNAYVLNLLVGYIQRGIR
ncbi:MAG TPA: DUF6585 family protein [Ktedonobacterales bacterium]